MVRTFHVLMKVFSACSLMPAFDLTTVVHLSPQPWSVLVEVAVVVDPSPDRSVMLFCCCAFMAFLMRGMTKTKQILGTLYSVVESR